MGAIIAVICFIIGIPIFLFGALIFTGLSIAGIVGSSHVTPAIIFASALLLVGSSLIFMGWRNTHEKKIMTMNADDQNSSVKTYVREQVSAAAKGVVIVVALISVIAIGAVAMVPLLDQMSSEINTDTTSTVDTDGIGTGTVTNPTNAGTIIAMKNSDFEPNDARVPLNDAIVWENYENGPSHTATSGTGFNDPNSGKIFDTSIIDSGEQSTPLQLTGVKVGDEIPYYCMIHSSMKGKLIVIAPTVG